jgi:hypothetical protein
MTRVMQEREAPAYLRDAQLSVRHGGSGFQASFTFNYPDEQVTSDPAIDLGFDRSMLDALLSSIENSLTDASQNGVWSLLEDPLGPPPTNTVRLKYQKLMDAVVSEGSSLYRLLSQIHQFDEFLQRVEALPDGSRITIQTEGAIIPWEIMYPDGYNQNSPTKQTYDKSKLWGCRFEIEQMVLRKGKSTDWKVKDHQKTKAYVNLNLNPVIDEELSQSGFSGPYKPRVAHENFFKSKLGVGRGNCIVEGHNIVSSVLSETPATIIYLYCHGKNADSISRELLEVDTKVYIDPDTVANEKYFYTSGPLLILNSCSSGAYSPLSLTNFYSEFKDKHAMGVIGTMIPMPATFAAAFGIRLIDDYVNHKGSQPMTIGSVLRNLRCGLVEVDNPLGLFYVLQCPLHATAKRA